MLQREFHEVWENVDCLITPTAPMGAPKIGQSTVKIADKDEDTRLASPSSFGVKMSCRSHADRRKAVR